MVRCERSLTYSHSGQSFRVNALTGGSDFYYRMKKCPLKVVNDLKQLIIQVKLV